MSRFYYTLLFLIVFGHILQSQLEDSSSVLIKRDSVNYVVEKWDSSGNKIMDKKYYSISQYDYLSYENKEWFKNGKLKYATIKESKDSVCEYRYYKSGQLEVVSCLKLTHETEKASLVYSASYCENGQKVMDQEYYKDNKLKKVQIKRCDGSILYQYNVYNGMRLGDMYEYYKNGQIKENIFYEYGVPVFKKTYDKNGELISDELLNIKGKQ